MHILNLKLENVKGHISSEFDFTDGINAIVGQNGAGKSTLLEAIGCTLFGHLAYNQRDFIREGEKTASITVTIQSSLDDRHYQVARRMGGSNQYYIYDPELDAQICNGTTDVHAFLKEHMEVDPNTSLETLFNDAVGVPQGTLTVAFAETPGRRRPIFDKLLQVEEYETAAKKLNEPQKKLKEQITQFDLKVTELATRLERLPQLEKAAKARQKEIAKIERQQEKIDSRLEKVLTKRQKLDAIQQEITSATNDEARLEQQMESLHTQQTSAEQMLAEAKEAKDLIKQNQSGHQAYVTAQTEQRSLGAQQEERQKLEAACNQIERANAQAQSQLAVIEQQLEAANAAEAEIAKLEPQIEKQSKLEQTRDDLQRQAMQLAETERAAAEQSKRQQTIEAQQKKLQAQFDEADKLRAARAEADADLTTARQKLTDSQQQMADFKAKAETIKEQSELLEDDGTSNCPICEQTLTKEHRSEMLARNQQQVDNLRDEYRDKQAAKSEADSVIQELEQRIQTLEQQLQRVPRREEIERIEQQLSTIVDSIKQSNEQIATLQAATAALPAVEKDLNTLGNPRQEAAIARQKVTQKPTLAQNQAQIQEQLATKQSELTQYQKGLSQFANLDEQLATITSQLRQNESAYQVVLANQNSADRLTERQTALKSLQAEQKEIAKQQKDLAKTRDKLEKKFDPQAYAQLVAEEQTERAEQATVRAQLTSLNDEETREQAEIDSLLAYQQQLETIQQERAKVETELNTLDMIRKLLRQAGPHITRALIHQVSNGAEQIFGDLMQDYSRRLVWNEDYGISLEIDGRKRQFLQLSGGEQMSAALSVRLALLREMSSIDVAFFDEPTTNLDEMRRESLAKQIVEVKGFRQLFVISHDDTFEQSTENIIRVERSGG